MKKLKCPKCGQDVIMFTFSEMQRWHHVVDGIPDPTSSACEAPVGAHGY